MNEEPRKSVSKFTRSGKNLTSLAGNLDVTGGTLIIDVRGRNFLGGLQDSASGKKINSRRRLRRGKQKREGEAAATTSRQASGSRESAEKGAGARWDELFTTLTGRRR